MATLNRVPLIAGNWKMNLDHLQAIAFVQKLAWTLREGRHDYRAVEVAVFPPFTDLRSVQNLVGSDGLDVAYGAQDVSEHESGAFTGEISASFLQALHCRYVILGHSERRMFHAESDEQIGRKLTASLRHSLIPILCVGETASDLTEHGASAIPVAQLTAAVRAAALTPEQVGLSGLVVAYEPVWAIGSGQAATPGQAEEVAARLRETLAALLGDHVAESARILYGGSVKSGNIASFMREGNIDGALVGGASLEVAEFASIARFLQHVGTV